MLPLIQKPPTWRRPEQQQVIFKKERLPLRRVVSGHCSCTQATTLRWKSSLSSVRTLLKDSNIGRVPITMLNCRAQWRKSSNNSWFRVVVTWIKFWTKAFWGSRTIPFHFVRYVQFIKSLCDSFLHSFLLEVAPKSVGLANCSSKFRAKSASIHIISRTNCVLVPAAIKVELCSPEPRPHMHGSREHRTDCHFFLYLISLCVCFEVDNIHSPMWFRSDHSILTKRETKNRFLPGQFFTLCTQAFHCWRNCQVLLTQVIYVKKSTGKHETTILVHQFYVWSPFFCLPAQRFAPRCCAQEASVSQLWFTFVAGIHLCGMQPNASGLLQRTKRTSFKSLWDETLKFSHASREQGLFWTQLLRQTELLFCKATKLGCFLHPYQKYTRVTCYIAFFTARAVNKSSSNGFLGKQPCLQNGHN